MSKPLTIYFLCETFTGYRPFFMQQVPQPEGLPPLYNTWNGYKDRGHRVHIFSQDFMYDRNGEWSHEEKQMHNIAIPFSFLKDDRFTLSGKILFRVARLIGLRRLKKYIIRLARNDPPDVIYSCSPYCSMVARAMAKKFNAVHVVRRFGTVLYEQMQGKSMGLQDSFYIEAREYRKPFDLLVMGNDGTRGEDVALHYGCPPEKLRFWTNGIDKALYDSDFDHAAFRKQLGYQENTPLILSLSRLAGWKRVDRVLRMMKKINDARPDVRLLIIGTGEVEDQLRKLTSDLGLDNVVRFVGAVQHKDVKNYLNGCDVYAQFFDLTNRCNPLFEAMVCGMAVVTLTDTSIDDLVIHEKNALRVEKDETDRAAKCVLDLLDNDERRRQLGRAAREHVIDTFQTWEQRIEMEINEVMRLVEKKKLASVNREVKIDG